MFNGLSSRVIKNSLSIIAGNFLNKLISIVVLMLLTNYLDPAHFGMYSFVTAYVLFFGIFTDMGINLFVTKEISGGGIEARTGFGHAVMLRFALTVFGLTAALFLVHLSGYPEETVRLVYAGVLALFLSFRGIFFRTVFDIPFMVSRKMHYPALINFLSELFVLGVIFLALELRVGLFTLILVINLANLPGFVLMAYLSVRHLRPRFVPHLKTWMSILRGSVPLGAAVFLEGVFVVIPFFILSFFREPGALGLYSLSFRLVSSLWIIPFALMISLFPDMSRHAGKSDALFAGDLFRGLSTMLVVGGSIALIGGSFTYDIVEAFAGPDYSASAPLISIMLWGTLMYFINSVLFHAFAASGHQRLNTLVWAFISLTSVLTSVLLIPAYRHYGAALSYSLSLGAGAVLNIYLLYRTMGIKVLSLAARFSACLIAPVAIISSGLFRPVTSTVSGFAAFLLSAALTGLLPLRAVVPGPASPASKFKTMD